MAHANHVAGHINNISLCLRLASCGVLDLGALRSVALK